MAATTMKAAQISKPGADFEIIEREVPQPTARAGWRTSHSSDRSELESDVRAG